jgi:methyltransferase
MSGAFVLLAFVTAERLAELWWARRNTRKLLAQGAIEHAPGHYPLMVLLHGLWLLGLWWLGADQPLQLGWLAVFLTLQMGRLWVLTTLGSRWTTRILTLPGERLVRSGPYRFISHPNYIVVVGEIAALPLCLGLPWYALAFSIANALLLAVRIRAEDGALNADSHLERHGETRSRARTGPGT